MTINLKNHILGFGACAAFFMISACSDVVDLESKDIVVTEGENVVSILVQPEVQAAAQTSLSTGSYSLSDGSQIDVLFWAVYRKESGQPDGAYAIVPDNVYVKDEHKSVTIGTTTVTAASGQNVQQITDDFWPFKVQIVTEEGYDYKVALWAENHQMWDAENPIYNTSDLQHVKVNYKRSASNPDNALNNDELRDAFCGVTEKITGGEKGVSHGVILKRPFAQLNVGTTGWDYEGAAVLRPATIIYTTSKMTITKVPQCYNVVAGETVISDQFPVTDITLDFNLMPAFSHVADNYQWDKIENTPWKDDKEGIVDDHNKGPLPLDHINETLKEEYLKVQWKKNSNWSNYEYKKYVSWSDYMTYRDGNEEDFNNGKIPETETYKYLSMCYILVAEPGVLKKVPGMKYGSVLTKVRMDCDGIKLDPDEVDPNGDTKYAKDDPDGIFTIYNVPVQKNWRTNILNNNFFVLTSKYIVDIVPDYCGDYTNIGGEYDDENKTPGGWINDIEFDNENNNNWQLKKGGKPNSGFDDELEHDNGEDKYHDEEDHKEQHPQN